MHNSVQQKLLFSTCKFYMLIKQLIMDKQWIIKVCNALN